MNDFIYSYPVKVYFGTDAAKKAIFKELGNYGKHVMLAYGGGSVKKSGVYDAVTAMLKEAGKEIVDFPGGSVLNFVSMAPCLIPEAGCGQSPQSLINAGNSGNSQCWKQEENRLSKTQN